MVSKKSETPGQPEESTPDRAGEPTTAQAPGETSTLAAQESRRESIHMLEAYGPKAVLDVNDLLKSYREKCPGGAVYALVQDLQQLALTYTNIIDQAMRGATAADIKKNIEEGGFLPKGTLPNPNVSAVVQRALDKIAQYRRALLAVVNQSGGELLNELGFEPGHTVSVGTSTGFPPAVQIAVAHTSEEVTVSRYY